MMNLYIPIEMREGYHDCQLNSDEGDPCAQQATWWCYPQGFLTTRIAMCHQHKQQVEQQEQVRLVADVLAGWDDDENPLDEQSSHDHEEAS